MNAISKRTADGNGIYTGTEYDALTGYVVGEYAYEWQDRDGDRYRTTCTVINLGRPDRGRVGEVDGLLVAEAWDSGTGRNPVAGRAAHAQKAAERHAQAAEIVVEYIQANGPCSTPHLAEMLGRKRLWMLEHLIKREGTIYYRLGGSNHTRWGLVGVHDVR